MKVFSKTKYLAFLNHVFGYNQNDNKITAFDLLANTLDGMEVNDDMTIIIFDKVFNVLSEWVDEK